MAANEAFAFRRALGLQPDQLEVFDLLAGAPALSLLRSADAVLIGGSGDHSVVRGGPWLAGALGAMERLYEHSVPTFASCWGFQGLAKALGGRVVTDHARAEVGVLPLDLTEAGERDPVFGPIGSGFPVVIGHEDIVDELPEGAVVETRVLDGAGVVESIVAAAEDYDAVMVGASGDSFSSRIVFGTIPERIAREAPGTVMVLKSHERVRAFLGRVAAD